MLRAPGSDFQSIELMQVEKTYEVTIQIWLLSKPELIEKNLKFEDDVIILSFAVCGKTIECPIIASIL